MNKIVLIILLAFVSLQAQATDMHICDYQYDKNEQLSCSEPAKIQEAVLTNQIKTNNQVRHTLDESRLLRLSVANLCNAGEVQRFTIEYSSIERASEILRMINSDSLKAFSIVQFDLCEGLYYTGNIKAESVEIKLIRNDRTLESRARELMRQLGADRRGNPL